MIDREEIFDTITADSNRNAVAVDDRIEMQVDSLMNTPEIGRLAASPELASWLSSGLPISLLTRSKGKP